MQNLFTILSLYMLELPCCLQLKVGRGTQLAPERNLDLGARTEHFNPFEIQSRAHLALTEGFTSCQSATPGTAFFRMCLNEEEMTGITCI